MIGDAPLEKTAGTSRGRSRSRLWLAVATVFSVLSLDVGLAATAFAAPSTTPVTQADVAQTGVAQTAAVHDVAAAIAETSGVRAVANMATFDPGLIITDTLFYDSAAMTASEIQSFLDSKIGTCQNSNCLNIATVPYPGRAREVSSSTGNVICEAIAGGTMRASELIYRTQVACGISAKVILVTLQKEQGLVLKTAPSDSSLRWAMGMACPDTAPCDSTFAGLGVQIVTGTRQLKVYKAAAFARQPGVQFVAWNPNSACGGTSVNVQNYATAALYNYTPYQPNPAALANPYGTGDSCSSYGNRNFWVFYTDWFGSTTGGGRLAIDQAYDEIGGLAILGAGVAYLDCPITTNRCWPQYEKGSIYWSSRSGADVVLGAKDVAYRALGGPDSPLGYPNTGEIPYTQNGGGSVQIFENGSLFDSASGIFPVYGAIRTAYFAKQGAWGELGWPTSNIRCQGANCSQIFEHGAIAVVGSDVDYLDQVERDVWVATGGITGALGIPSYALAHYEQNGGGTARVFTTGSIFASSAGTFAVLDPIRPAYFAHQGAWGQLGWPASAQQCAQEGCWQRFQNGAVLTSGSLRYNFEKGEFDDYVAAGGPTGPLGFPTSVQYRYAENGGGTTRIFANGSLFRSPAGGFSVIEPIRTAYFAQRGAWGPLGWPTSTMVCNAGTCTQSFQGGTLSNAGTGPSVDPPVGETELLYRTRLADVARQQNLGLPTSDVLVYTENGGGVARVYGATTIFSSADGAYAVSGDMRTAYFAKRGAWGELGWPVAAQQCGAGGCWQRFQHGTVYSSAAGAFALANAEFDTYVALGGPSGRLGMPTSDLITYTENGGGTTRIFARGSIFTSSAGSFAVTEPIRAAYFAKRGAWGELGWPSGEVLERGGTVAQMFQYGAIAIISGSTQYLSVAERDAWIAAGGPAGVLGIPDSKLYTYTENGGGTARVYTGGTIFSSAAGAFAVTEPIRAAYFAKQGAWGELGWPTSNAVKQGSTTIQEFGNGTIVVNTNGAQYLSVAEQSLWTSMGGVEGSLGVPTSLSTYTENGGGTARVFTNGTIFSSAAGVFAVTEPIRAAYFASQGAWGSYGWPASAMTCADGSCVQQFQNGTITVPGG